MWYLITFEINDLLKVKINREDTDFRWIGKEADKPVTKVSEGIKKHEIEWRTDYPDAYYLDQLYALNPRNFILLNHAAVLLKWESDVDSLTKEVANILSREDKYVIMPVTAIASSNFLPAAFMSSFLHK